MRRTLPVLFVVAAVVAIPAGAQVDGLTRVSTDPFTNPDCQHQTQVEPDSFSFGNVIVAAFQSGRCFDGGASGIGFATSLDGGVTWTSGFLPGLTVNSVPPGPWDRASDPVVAYDAAHDVWIINTLGIGAGTGGSILASLSHDSGLTWSNPLEISVATGFLNSYDKNWMACDSWPSSPYRGRCYVTWDDVGRGGWFLMSTSDDGGRTWSPKQTVQGRPSGLGGQPIPRPDGSVVVPASNSVGTRLLAFGSFDGGLSWRGTVPIADIRNHQVAGDLRASTFLPSSDVDAAGKVYVVWPDCRFRAGCSSNDLVMVTWDGSGPISEPMRIPIDPVGSPVDHFIPGLAVDHGTAGNSARLALAFYFYPRAACTVDTCRLGVGFISSQDGGATWSRPQLLAGPMSLDWIARTSSGRMVGDYISTSFAGDHAVPVFAAAIPPIGSFLQEATYSTRLPVTALEAYPLAVLPEPVRTWDGDAPVPVRPLYLP